jgi:hypothetical protein
LNALPWLGSGLGYRPQFRAELFENRARIDFLEIIADHYFDASPEKLAELDLLAAHFPLVSHGLDLSLGGAEGLDAGYVEKLARLIDRINPPWFSEHLCFTRGGRVSIGHLAALPYTFAAIDALARNVDMLRKRIKAPPARLIIYCFNGVSFSKLAMSLLSQLLSGWRLSGATYAKPAACASADSAIDGNRKFGVALASA